MSPTIVVGAQDDRLVLAVGSPGGLNIIGYVTRTLIAALDEDRPMQQAIAAPNVVNRNGPILLERGTAAEALAEPLRALGHAVEIRALESGLHGIRVNDQWRIVFRWSGEEAREVRLTDNHS